jgi:hypothetical protein
VPQLSQKLDSFGSLMAISRWWVDKYDTSPLTYILLLRAYGVSRKQSIWEPFEQRFLRKICWRSLLKKRSPRFRGLLERTNAYPARFAPMPLRPMPVASAHTRLPACSRCGANRKREVFSIPCQRDSHHTFRCRLSTSRTAASLHVKLVRFWRTLLGNSPPPSRLA